MEKNRIEAVDWTILSTLDECPRKAQYRFQFGIVPREPSVAVEFGRAIHEGLGAYYESERNLGIAIANFTGGYGAPEGEELRTREKGLELLTAYDKLFYEEPWEYLGGEQLFALDVDGAPYMFCGFIDAFGKQTEGKEQFVIQEWKTSSSPWNFCSRPNGQLVGYAWAARSLFGEEVRRVYVTMAGVFKTSKEGIMPAKKKGEPGRSVVNREIVDLDPWDFEEWKLDFIEKCFELEGYQVNDYWPKRTRACANYGGCSYQALCVAPPSQREMFMEANFRVEKWEPLMERR